MTKGLAIETSGRNGSVALAQDGETIAEETFSHGLQHAAGIVVHIDRLCRQQNWAPADLDEIYVSVGPGSFTGLRIGVTLAKTLAFATGANLVAVPSVEVLARNAPPEAERVIVVLDAKRDQIFTTRLARSAEGMNDWHYEESARLDSLTAMLVRSPRPVHLLGEGIPSHDKFLPPNDPGIVITPPEAWVARAAVVAAVGHAAAREGQFTDPDRLTPIYIRIPEAEEKLQQRETPR